MQCARRLDQGSGAEPVIVLEDVIGWWPSRPVPEIFSAGGCRACQLAYSECAARHFGESMPERSCSGRIEVAELLWTRLRNHRAAHRIGAVDDLQFPEIRQWFRLVARHRRAKLSMPSVVVDDLWLDWSGCNTLEGPASGSSYAAIGSSPTAARATATPASPPRPTAVAPSGAAVAAPTEAAMVVAGGGAAAEADPSPVGRCQRHGIDGAAVFIVATMRLADLRIAW